MKFSFKKNPLLILGLAIFTFVGVVGCSSNELSDKVAQNEEKIAQVTNSVTTLQGSLTALQARVTEVTSELEELTELQNAVTSLQADLTALEETVSALSGLDGSIGELQAKVNALETKATTLETKAAALEESYQTLNTTKAEKAAVAELSSAVEALSTTVSGLSTNSATKAELEAAAAELNDAVADLEDALEVLDAALDARLDAVEGRLDVLEESVAGLVTTVAGLSTAMAALASQEDVTALQQATADLPQLRTTIGELVSGLGELRELIGDEDSGLAKRIQALEDTITEMGGQLEIRYIREDDYYNATAILAGAYPLSEEELAAWNALVAAVEQRFGHIDFGTAKPYSHAAWTKIQSAFNSGHYTTEQRAAFAIIAESEYFFLGREVSVQGVKDRFESFKEYIVELPTLNENFHNQVNAVSLITVDTITDDTEANKQWSDLVELYAAAEAAGYTDETYLADKGRYLNLKDSYDNLVTAKAAAVALKAIVDGRTVTEVGELALLAHKADYIADKEALAALNEEFFPAHPVDNPETEDVDESAVFVVTDLYPVGYSATNLIPATVETISQRDAYITLLENAKTDFAKDLDATEGVRYIYGVLPGFDVTAAAYYYNGVNFNKIEEDYDAVLAWATAQGVDSENLAYIYAQVTLHPFEDATKANEYAETLESIYQAGVVATELKAKIQPYELDDTSLAFFQAVDHAQEETLRGYATIFTNLRDAIQLYVEGREDDLLTTEVDESVEGFPDGTAAVTVADYAAMLAKATVNETYYLKVVDRLNALDTAETAIAAVETFIDGKLAAQLQFSDWALLFNTEYTPLAETNASRATLDHIYSTYRIGTVDETNYGNEAMKTSVEAKYTAVAAAYDSMAESVRTAVEKAQELLTAEVAAHPLERARELKEIIERVGGIITTYGLTSSDIKTSSGSTQGVNFNTLQSSLVSVLTTAAQKAALAQAGREAQDENVNAVIGLIPAFAADTYYKYIGEAGYTYTKQTSASAPANWATEYMNYFTKSGSNYVPVPVGTGAPTWAANTYYVRTGSEYQLLTAEPANWLFTYNTYYTEEAGEYTLVPTRTVKLDDEETITVAFNGLYAWAVSVFGEEKIGDDETALATIIAHLKEYVAKVQDTEHEEDDPLHISDPHYIINSNEYHFYTNDEVTLITDFMASFAPVKAASEEAWAAIEGTLIELAAKHFDYDEEEEEPWGEVLENPTYTINDRAAYTNAMALLDVYVHAYYVDYTEASAVNGEWATTSHFTSAHNAFGLFYAAAEEEFAEIVADLHEDGLLTDSAVALTAENLEAKYEEAGVKHGKYELALEAINNFYTDYDPLRQSTWFENGHGTNNLHYNFLLNRTEKMYVAIVLAYQAVNNHHGEYHKVLTAQPADWGLNYANYRQLNELNAFVAVPAAHEAPAWAANKYYSRSGAGTELSPYVYTLLTAAPANWATNYADYFKVTDEAHYAQVTGLEAPEWAANTYYSRSGAGTELSPYVYTLTEEVPADWPEHYGYYYTYVPAEYGAVEGVPVAPTWAENTYYEAEVTEYNGVAPAIVIAAYDLYIRTFMYGSASTTTQVNNYFGVYDSALDDLIDALPTDPEPVV